MKHIFTAAMLTLALIGCRPASFQSIDKDALNNGDLNQGGGFGDGDGTGKTNDDYDLVVSVPVKSIPAGGDPVQATVTTNNGTNLPPIKWTVTSPEGKDPGTIDDNGKFTPPKDVTDPYPVDICAESKLDMQKKACVPITITPPNVGDDDLGLIVSVPVMELPFGSNQTQATARLTDGTVNPPVTWTVTGPMGKDPGMIDANGVYTSPAMGTETYPISIEAVLKSDPTKKGSVGITLVPAKKPALVVTVPTPEVKSGGNKVPVTAELVYNEKMPPEIIKNPAVDWSVMGPTGQVPGTIDANGVYTSPLTIPHEYTVTITATLKTDPTIQGTAQIKILKDDTIFARCTKANVVYPIEAKVYQLKVNGQAITGSTSQADKDKVVIPSDWNDTSKAEYKATVCMDEYNVAPRNFDTGFPGLESSFTEWFGLHTTTTLIIPKSGRYSFKIDSDDGSKLWISRLEANAFLIDNNRQRQSEKEGGGVVPVKQLDLAEGEYPLVLDYFQGPKYRIALQLYWMKPGDTNWSIVPKTAFK